MAFEVLGVLEVLDVLKEGSRGVNPSSTVST